MFIPDPNFCSSRIPDLHQRLKYYNPKKWFLSNQKYYPGWFIPDSDPDFLPIPDPKVKKAPDPGSGFRNTDGYRYPTGEKADKWLKPGQRIRTGSGLRY
jgi:hypothetical protein